jgi:chromosome segregation ATPase
MNIQMLFKNINQHAEDRLRDIYALTTEMKRLNESIKDLKDKLHLANQQIIQKEITVLELRTINNDFEQKIALGTEAIEELNRQITDLSSELMQKSEEINRLNMLIVAKNEEYIARIEALEKKSKKARKPKKEN